MPSLTEYRHSLALESGPYVGPEQYTIRATAGSTVAKLVCDVYPIQSGIAQNDLLTERPLYRPYAGQASDRHRVVQTYDPPTGTITPDLPWTVSPLSPPGSTTYAALEAHPYRDLETFTYECLDGTGVDCPGGGGIGELFEILGPWDVPTMHRIINDALKQCWLVVDVVCTAIPGVSRHDLRTVCPWLQDPNHVRQAGVLSAGIDPWVQDPFAAIVYGQVERDGGTMLFNTNGRTFADGDQIWLRCYKRAYDHCRVAGGTYGEQSGLALETDEAPVNREWLTSAALIIGWRRFGHVLEPAANQRLIRDQATAAAWFNDQTHQHFTAVAPQITFRKARTFGPRAVA
ncbi:MAG TPA: hypothetical protein VFB50_02520 [Chloroflexota bacterium]|nr:hypothetical protein [Chloroflexota bacterium]